MEKKKRKKNHNKDKSNNLDIILRKLLEYNVMNGKENYNFSFVFPQVLIIALSEYFIYIYYHQIFHSHYLKGNEN